MVEKYSDQFPLIIRTYDEGSVDPEMDIWSISFSEPESKSTYCVGYKYLGGIRQDPNSWEFDHVCVQRPRG